MESRSVVEFSSATKTVAEFHKLSVSLHDSSPSFKKLPNPCPSFQNCIQRVQPWASVKLENYTWQGLSDDTSCNWDGNFILKLLDLFSPCSRRLFWMNEWMKWISVELQSKEKVISIWIVSQIAETCLQKYNVGSQRRL